MAEFKSWRAYWDFCFRVISQNRYVRIQEDLEFLDAVLKTSKGRIRVVKKGQVFLRAQLGCGDEYVEEMDDSVDAPLPKSRMKPKSEYSKNGRANPEGMPYLYLATTIDTAMSEVRPWLGAKISCGYFEILKDLKVIDFSVMHGEMKAMIYFEEPSPEVREKVVWAHMDNSFSQPITRQDDAVSYIPTQILAELFKNEGYDGIGYKSAFEGGGYNICLFDVGVAKLTSCHLYETKKAEYNFSEIANPYYCK